MKALIYRNDRQQRPYCCSDNYERRNYRVKELGNALFLDIYVKRL